MKMKDFPGTPGTLTGLVLRISQCIFAVGSIASMATTSSFFNFTAFCYLMASMSLLVIWSFVLALLDAYAWMRKVVLYNAILGSLFVVGDWELVEALQRDHASPYIEEPLAMELVPPPTKICQGERPMLKRFLRFLASRAYEDFVYMNNKKALWGTAQLFMHPRYMDGAATKELKYGLIYMVLIHGLVFHKLDSLAAAQVKKAKEVYERHYDPTNEDK